MKELDEMVEALAHLMESWEADAPDETWGHGLNEMSEDAYEARIRPIQHVLSAYRKYAGQAEADRWNWKNEVGVVVDVTLDFGQVVRTVTRSPAWSLGDGTPVVKLRPVEGVARFSGGYKLDRVNRAPVTTEADEEGLEYTRAGGMAECEACGKFLRDHPDDLDHPGYDGKPFLIRRCDGSLVKL